jgi:hypothetical protein
MHHVPVKCLERSFFSPSRNTISAGMCQTQEAELPEPEQSRSNIRWSRDASDAMFGVYAGRYATYRLVVEQAGTAWEWIVWPVGEPSRGQAGESDTAMQATRAANDAARRIDQDIV